MVVTMGSILGPAFMEITNFCFCNPPNLALHNHERGPEARTRLELQRHSPTHGPAVIGFVRLPDQGVMTCQLSMPTTWKSLNPKRSEEEGLGRGGGGR